jgi:hypothetical protein
LEAGVLACFDLEAGGLGLEASGRFPRFAVFFVTTRFFDIIAPSSESDNQVIVG